LYNAKLCPGPTLKVVGLQTQKSSSTTHVTRKPKQSGVQSKHYQNMSSIDAVINSGPSSAQQQEIDEPAEKFDALNVREDSEGWNDVEDDAEEFNVQCLFCSETAPSLAQSLAHMKSEHDFDLVAFRSRHGG
jgi:hypothetical protein